MSQPDTIVIWLKNIWKVTLNLIKQQQCGQSLRCSLSRHVSRLMTKPTKWHPAKSKISLGICPVWSVFAVRMKKAWVLIYLLSTLQRLWSDWAHRPYCWFCRAMAHVEKEEAPDKEPHLWVQFEPCHEKTCLWGFRLDKPQTDLLSFRDKLESWYLWI